MRNEPIELVISPQGDVRCIYQEELEFHLLGRPEITRASHVEPTDDGQWTADLTPVGGPVLGPFAYRSNALSMERRWLAERWLGNGRATSVSE